MAQIGDVRIVPRVESSALTSRCEELEAALRTIEAEVYGRPEPFCRRIAEKVAEVLGVAPR